jgi:hypothetical protein
METKPTSPVSAGHKGAIMRALCYATLVSGLTVFCLAQSGPTPKLVLNESRPIVYIELDHIGPRPPVEDGEPDRGLWLRLVNNSVVPIEVNPMDTGPDPALRLLPDEIVGISTRIEKSYVLEPKMPMGYATGDIIGTELIQFGKGFLFSVPVTHVGRRWYLQVPFRFHLPPINHGTQPLSYAQFTLEDIPENLRSKLRK